ncbi:MAG: holo-ACP synthase [Saezia sp.]
MIYGIGTDICEIARIAQVFERHAERFPLRILGTDEYLVYEARRQKVAQRGIKYLATRFAAKEAFSKAIGMGIRMPMTWHNCEILSLPSGQPYIKLNNDLKDWFEQKRLKAHVSITDEVSFVMAFVVVENIE